MKILGLGLGAPPMQKKLPVRAASTTGVGVAVSLLSSSEIPLTSPFLDLQNLAQVTSLFTIKTLLVDCPALLLVIGLVVGPAAVRTAILGPLGPGLVGLGPGELVHLDLHPLPPVVRHTVEGSSSCQQILAPLPHLLRLHHRDQLSEGEVGPVGRGCQHLLLDGSIRECPDQLVGHYVVPVAGLLLAPGALDPEVANGGLTSEPCQE